MTEPFRPKLLAGKTAFIAGGSSGINLGIAERFADLGANLVILSRSPEKVNAAVAALEKRGAKALGGAIMNVDGGVELGDASADCLTVPARRAG